MEANYPYAIKNQRQRGGSKIPLEGALLWMPVLVLYGIRLLA